MNFDLLRNLRKRVTEMFFEDIFKDLFVEDGFIIRHDGNPAAGFVLSLPEKESMSESEILAFQDSLEKAFASLPVGTVCHIQGRYYYADGDLEALDGVADGYATNRMREYLVERPILRNSVVLYVIFDFSVRRGRTPASTFFANAAAKLRNPLKDVLRHKALAQSYLQTFLSQATAVHGLSLVRLDDIGLRRDRVSYFNLKFFERPHAMESSIENRGHTVAVGDNLVRAVFLRRTGNNLFRTVSNDHGVTTFMPWMMGHFLSFPHLVNLSFRICDTEKELRSLELMRNLRRGLGALQKQVDRMIIGDIEAFTHEMRASGKRLVAFNHNVLAWDRDADQLSMNVDMIKTAYSRMNGSLGISDAYNAGNYYFTYSPGMALDMFSTLLTPLDEALLHFDFSIPTRSEGAGVILSNRELEPLLVDMWSDKLLVNRNRLVIAPSGAGKSFMQAVITAQELDQRTEFVILDVGGSYKNLFSLNKDYARYFEYTDDMPLSFNPFLIPKDRHGHYNLTDDKIIFLLTCITIFWKDTKKGATLTKEEESVFARLLTLYYERVNRARTEVPRLDRFFQFVVEYARANKDHADFQFFNVQSFMLVLEKFTTGSYAKAVNSDESDNIGDHRLVCFDMAGIQNDPILYPVVCLVTIQLVLDKILADPTKRKVIVIDEAWTMLTGAMGSFIEYLFRTIRKSQGAVIIVSQSVVELINSPVGKAIRNNAATKIMLDHSSQPSSIPDLQEFFGLTNHQIELLKSLRTRSNWREILVIRGSSTRVYAVDAGPHAGAAFSSWSQDRAEITRLTKIGGPEYAVNQVVEDRKNGTA